MSLGKRSRKQVAAVREDVFERDQHSCVVNGSIWSTIQPCAGVLTVQHRVGKGMGGSAQYDAPSSLLAMCAVHNVLAESSSEFADYCKRNGLSVPRYVAARNKITQIPVRYSDGWYLLSALQRVAISDSLANELMFEIYGFENSQ
jgi:hypothetical protein